MQITETLRRTESELRVSEAKQKNNYVKVPTADPLGTSYQKATRQITEANPNLAPLMSRIDTMADHILHGKRIDMKLQDTSTWIEGKDVLPSKSDTLPLNEV